MAGLLRRQGYQFTPDVHNAEVVVINTCGFIADARQESYATIEEMLARKEAGKLRGVIVAGCLAQRERQQLLEKYPAVDQFVGVFAREEIAAAVERVWQPTGEREIFCPAPGQALPDDHRLRMTPRHLAYLKIAEGCNRLCTFCAIPGIRGRYVSKPIEQVVAEAEELAAHGVRELILVAQDTSFYGIDLYGEPRLAELVRRLEEVPGLAWIRLMYLYPMHIGEDLMELLAAGGKTLPYLDLPLQHISDGVLARMRRRVTCDETLRLLERLRSRVPNLALRTTLMVGFPGETDTEFEELMTLVRQQRFERLGVFAYCDEGGTPAAEFEGRLPEDIKCARREALMAAQQEIAFEWTAAQVGQELALMVDRAVQGEKGAWIGRTWADAPEIDGAVYITGTRLSPGRLVTGEIVAAKDYDLVAYCE